MTTIPTCYDSFCINSQFETFSLGKFIINVSQMVSKLKMLLSQIKKLGMKLEYFIIWDIDFARY